MGLQEGPSLLGQTPPKHLVKVNRLRDSIVQIAQPEHGIVVQYSHTALHPAAAELAREVAELPVSRGRLGVGGLGL